MSVQPEHAQSNEITADLDFVKSFLIGDDIIKMFKPTFLNIFKATNHPLTMFNNGVLVVMTAECSTVNDQPMTLEYIMKLPLKDANKLLSEMSRLM
jgi:hypothetical protein